MLSLNTLFISFAPFMYHVSDKPIGGKPITTAISNKPTQTDKKILLINYLASQCSDQNDLLNLMGLDADLNNLDLSNIKLGGVIPSREVLEIIVAKGGSLRGTTLAPGIDVSGMAFTNVKIDKNMLSLLFTLNANVQGVDLSDENLEGMDLRNIDLSNANLSNTKLKETNLSYATFAGTNFTGVDLSKTWLEYVTYNKDGCKVIVSQNDRKPHIDLFVSRLSLVVSGEGGIESDKFCGLPGNIIKKIRDDIFFTFTDKTFLQGETIEEGGAQSFVLNKNFDNRCINSDDISAQQVSDKKEDALHKLLGEGFTIAQKTLFHRARAALWKMCSFNVDIFGAGRCDNADMSKEDLLFQIYLDGGDKGRLIPEMVKACFDAVLPFVWDEHSTMSVDEIANVRELFESPDFFW